MWSALILLLIVATDASALVSYITRFTEENFAVLISFIFIYESFAKISKILQSAFTIAFDDKVFCLEKFETDKKKVFKF